MYSMNWARDVVKTHYKRYTRASYLILTSTHLTTEIVARWLAKSNDSLLSRHLWEFWRTFVPKLQQELDKRVPAGTTQMFSKLTRSILSDVFWSFCENCPEYLWTARDWWQDHEEQFFKARPRPRSPGKETRPQDGPFLPGFGG